MENPTRLNIQSILVIVALLVANNILLITYFDLGDNAAEQPIRQAHTSPPSNAAAKSDIPDSGQVIPQTKLSSGSFQVIESHQDEIAGLNFRDSFLAFSESAEFKDIMDGYAIQSDQRIARRMQSAHKMTAIELYNLFHSSERAVDRTLALEGLSEGKIAELEDYQIKEVYLGSRGETWGRMQALKTLLERGDAEALEWSKQALEDQPIMMVDGDWLSILYDTDSEFVRNYVNSLSLDEATQASVLLFQQDELKHLVLKKHLNEILDSNNSSVFQLKPHNMKLDLSQDQQFRVIDLLAQSSREKREFGLSIISQVHDANLLRKGFSNLTRDSERQMMLSSLMEGKYSDRNRALAIELAEGSDSQKMRLMAEELKRSISGQFD